MTQTRNHFAVACAALTAVSSVVMSGCGSSSPSAEPRGTVTGNSASSPNTQAEATAPGDIATPGASATASPTASATGSSAPSTDGSSEATKSKDSADKDKPTKGVPEKFRFSVRKLSDQDRKAMTGVSWHPGCPVPMSKLRKLRVAYRTFNGRVKIGEVVVHESVVKDLADAFRVWFNAGFPFESIRPVRDFAGSDDKSMAANNTSAFNCRKVVGAPKSWSNHAYGKALDVNPVHNPYLLRGKVLPPAGSKYAKRKPVRPGMLTAKDPAVKMLMGRGWRWGGQFGNPDFQHIDVPRRRK